MDVLPLPTRRAAVATLVATEGSTPRETGARMWVDETGAIIGSVTIGGCVDARVIEASQEVIDAGVSRVVAMALGDEDAWALGMTCAGTVEVLIEPYRPAPDVDPVARSLTRAGEAVRAGRRHATVIPLDGHAGRLDVSDAGDVDGTLGDAALDRAAIDLARTRLDEGRAGTATLETPSGGCRVFVDVHAPPLTLVVFGATHVAMPLVEMARPLGWRTVVVDGRERFATRERFPDVDALIVGMPSEIATRLPLGPSSLVVLLSHDYKYDLPVLQAVLASDAAYVGCLGSARRGKAMLEFLAAQGVPAAQLARVRIPVGLDVGARSAAEIALSVLAEGLAAERGRAGGPMRERRRGA
ncbi:MAG: XdhC family protein [Gemmatimonadaceae bacterium]|nr:XdhC family protein [Gemmatimonadaceae bacterium]